MTAAKSRGDRRHDGRAVAYLAVLDVLRGEGFAGQTLRRLRSAEKLSGRDAALAMQIALGSVRHLLTIEHVLSAVARFDPRRTRRRLHAILYTAAYQIIWMDRVPVFAAVDEAVNQARSHVGGRSPGMVNAVLRNLTRALAERRGPWRRLDPRHVRVSWDQACVFAHDVLPPADPPDHVNVHLAAATGERMARYRTLADRFGSESAEQIAWASQAVPVTVLQRNTLRIGPEEFQKHLREHLGEDAELTADAAYLPPGTQIADVPLFAEGTAFVQDPTAHAAARLVEARPGERVLDLCAAPGGKSMVLAMQMEDRGEVVACDVSPERLALVQENVARLGLTCVRTSPLPAREPGDASSLGTFDAVLLDVPCTNTGVIARRPEARLGLTDKKLQSLAGAQCDLLELAALHVRPGGRLVYSTCSLEPDENEVQIERFLADQAGWSLDYQQTTLPAWGQHQSAWCDGGFTARLARSRGPEGPRRDV
jgi:16S rRNA (cytosine967-C5)-methyltransferase